MPRDRRYTIQREWCGHGGQRHVVRFCSAWVGCSSSLREAGDVAAGHRNARAALLDRAT